MPIAMITPTAMWRQVDAPYTRLLQEAGFEVRFPEDSTFTRGRDAAETIRVLRGVSGLVAGGEFLTEEVLAGLPELRVIARAGVGYDRVDVAAATRHGVLLTITPTANHEAVAEQAMGLLLAVSRNVALHDRMMRAGQWQVPVNRPLRGTTIGFVGLGRIGRSTALRAKAFRMQLIACDPYADPKFVAEHGIELVDFDTLLARSDVVSIHAPLNDETRGRFKRATFAKMKPGSILINTARGGLVVEADLVEALKSGHLAGAGLDVFEVEPIAPDSPLLKLDNVVMTPHRSSEETRAMVDMGVEAARCIVELHAGRWPEGCVVNHQLRNNWRWNRA